ncbi:lytic transglycosylase [Thiomicrorhabdus immobilis]|uniref:Lytic transglycosylase n=2 Tax=Thiomicrorhabdus immobilis TaxID=2791037 RepID=A0ABN6D0W4_9GAMM|nr:lytic transglycosylase [Thiomicrorhabdus immobilis]
MTLGLMALGLNTLVLTGCVSNSSIQSDSGLTPSAKPQVISNSRPIQTPTTADVTPDNLRVDLQTHVYHPIIWDEMRYKFDLADENFGHYSDYLAFYGERKTHLKRVSERAKPYLHYILNEVKKRKMPYEIALLPAVESGFRPFARSHQKAVGLWQFIPSTANIYDLDQTWWYDGRKDVVESTRAALDYLQKLYKLNNNDWLLALASYNAGLGNVYRAQKKYRKKHKDQTGIKEYLPNFWEIKEFLPQETQGYVPKLLAVAHIIEYSERFNIELEPIANRPYFSQIALNKQVSLGQVAKLSATSAEVLASLNPGYHQPATPPNGPYHLLLPVDKAEAFEEHIENNQEIFNIQWQKHKIRQGDSLSVIAKKYKTSSKAIQRLNGMKNANIRAGKTLLIPIPADKIAQVKAQLAQAEQQKPYKVNKTPNKTTQAKSVDTTAANSHLHKVKSGDSLWLLAKQYNVSSQQIAKANKLSFKTPLKLGQNLVIPGYEATTKIQHTLKTGESLWLVAKRYKVTTQDIAAWNNISAKKVLQPGMKLTIWTKETPNKSVKYVVKNGDNLWNIAKANQVSAQQLALHNNLSLKSLLKPGQIIKIPLTSAKNT